MPPPQEIRPYEGTINKALLGFIRALFFLGGVLGLPRLFVSTFNGPHLVGRTAKPHQKKVKP